MSATADWFLPTLSIALLLLVVAMAAVLVVREEVDEY